ncbi:MAG: hypothetical protein IPL71_04385 [Anaerolineales bacterium]|uniref:hypothetical protein n=1 Tax=Candidatus Villigracilis proximus TaxID=3140683 RepID=UPI0031363BDC|nr:hypothetical protein [Anaerolineales bacterium]
MTRRKIIYWYFNAGHEMATFAESPQLLINKVRDAGGLAFLAHPDDPEAAAFRETDISWEDWSVQNYTGIELWNALSELKTIVPTKLHGAFYALFRRLWHHPIPNTIAKWDELLGTVNGWWRSAAPMRTPCT